MAVWDSFRIFPPGKDKDEGPLPVLRDGQQEARAPVTLRALAPPLLWFVVFGRVMLGLHVSSPLSESKLAEGRAYSTLCPLAHSRCQVARNSLRARAGGGRAVQLQGEVRDDAERKARGMCATVG